MAVVLFAFAVTVPETRCDGRGAPPVSSVRLADLPHTLAEVRREMRARAEQGLCTDVRELNGAIVRDEDGALYLQITLVLADFSTVECYTVEPEELLALAAAQNFTGALGKPAPAVMH
jgi:hypothetical protein